MKQLKLLLTLGLLIMLCVTGTLYILAKNQSEADNSHIDIARLPRLTVQGVVTAIETDEVDCTNPCNRNDHPLDTGTIKITKVISVDNPSNMALSDVTVGQDILVRFGYSARPAKIKIIPEADDATQYGPNGTVSHQVNPENYLVRQENGQFVYTDLSINKELSEKTLPGLKIGDTFSATIDFTGAEYLIGTYEVL
jgi:hypothetical protein